MRARAVTATALAVLALPLPALARGAAAPSVCRSACFVNVESGRFKAVGAGATASTLTMRVGATVKWRVPAGERHSVVERHGLFTFGAGAAPDTTFELTPSAGRFDYRDSLGGAGTGTLVVQPRFKRLTGGGYEVAWGPGGTPPPDRVHAVRWFVVRGAEIEASGTWGITHDAVRAFTRTERLSSAFRLEQGRSFCVEVRSGRGTPTRWSGWANACVTL